MGKYEDMLRDYREKQTGETQQTQQPTAQQQTPASARVGGALLYGQTGRQTAPSDPYSAMLADYRRRNGQPQQAQTPAGQSAGVGSALLAGAPKTPEQRVQNLMGLPPEQRVQAVMDLIPIKKNGDYSDAERIWDATKGVGYRAAGSYYRAATDAVLNPSEMLGTSMGSVMAPSLLGVVEAAQKAKNEGRNLSLSDISNAAAAPFSMDALSQRNGRSMLWNLAEEWKKNTPRWEARQDKAHELISKGDELQQKASEGLGFLGKLGIDVYSGALDMLPDMALNTLVPGAGTAAMVTRAYGGSADRARANGADWGEQILYGAAHAAISYGTEKISGIGSLRGEAGFIDNLVEKGVDRFVAHGGNRIIGRMIAGFGSEGAEEMLEDVLGYGVDYLLRLGNDGFDFTDGKFDFAGMLYDGLVGGLLGGLGGGFAGIRSNGTSADFRNVMRQSAEESAQLHMGEYIINQLYEGKPGNDTFIADVLGNKDARAALELMMGQPLTGPIGQQIETVQAFAEGLRSDAGNVTNALAALLQNTQNTEAPQEAAGEPVPQGGTEIAPTGAETPTADPALLNSQQGAEAAQGVLPPLEIARRSDNGEKPAALAEMQTPTGNTAAPSQQNIDNTAPAAYTKTEGNGGITNEQGRSNAEAGAGVAPGEGRLGAQYQPGDGSGRSPESAGIVRVDPELQKAYEKSGVVDYGLQDSSGDSAAYSSALEEGRNSDPEHGWMVTPQTAEDLQGKKSFLAPDRSEGVVVTTDGDIEGVFKNQNTGKPGALMRLLPQAVAAGGTKLDCYGEGLVFNYAPYGFIPVARVEFNEKYANPGWDPSKGRPYVYVMMHNGSSPAQMVENKTNKNYHKWTMEELEALPTYDKDGYDDAVAYRNGLMEQRKAADQQASDDLYNELGEQYGTIEEGENAARESAVPRQTGTREKVGEAVRTMYEAEAIAENRLQDIRNAVVNGDFSFETVTDEALTRDAESKIKRDGWDRSLRDWTADVRSGKANEELVAMGATLLNNAANSGMDGKSFVDLAVDYNELCHRLGRGLEAARILKRLSPSARLYALQRTIARINEERNAKKSEQKKAAKEVEKALEGLDSARKSAMESTEKELSDPTSEAAKRVAEAIRRDVDRARAAENGEESEPTREERMAKLALRLARERLNAGKGGRKVATATDVLREIAQDEGLFREIYEKAQAEFRTEEGEDYLDDVEEFTNTPPGLDKAKGTEGTKTFARAIAESAARTGENSKYIREQAALGVSSEDIANAIASDLIEKTGASDQLAESIREGCRNYVNEILQGDTQTGSERAASIVSRQMRYIGQTFRALADKSGATKESVQQDLADQLAMWYSLDPQSAGRIADNVMTEYEAQLSEAMEKELERRYGKKERAGKVSPEFRQMLEEALNLGAFDSKYAREATQKVFGTEADIKLDPELAEAFLNAKTDAERDAIISQMQQRIADQIPATLLEKWNALRYLNMLGNFKTQGRNLAGNATMMVTAAVKNHLVRGSLEGLYGAVNKNYEKTSTVAYSPRLFAEAFNDWKTVKDDAMGERKYSDAGRQFEKGIQEKRRIFKFKPLEGYRLATNWAMDMGDQIFSVMNYADAMASWMQAHKVKSISEMSPEMLERARQHAIKEAQEATFRDTNGVSKWASGIGRGNTDSGFGKFMSTVTEGILPFRKTPANVLVRAWEYSPLGTLTAIGKKAAGVTDAQGFINDLSKSFTGSGLAVLGYLLAAAGKIRTPDDDDKLEAFRKEQGQQDYSYIRDDGSSATLDWLAPDSIPLFMGATAQKVFAQGGLTGDQALKILGQITAPMLEMSMLSGVNDALEMASGYSNDMDAVPSLVLNSLLGYLTQGWSNSLLRQAEQASEVVRRTSYTDKDSGLPSALQRKISQYFGGIPGIDYQQSDYIDGWGRKTGNGGAAERIINAFLNPATVKEDRSTPYDKELERLYSAGLLTQLPTAPARSTDVKGQRLTPEEYDTYATVGGEKRLELIGDFLGSEEYKNLSDVERAEIIGNLYEYANYYARKAVLAQRGEKYENKEWDKMDDLQNAGGDPIDYLIAKNAIKTATEGNDFDAVDALLGGLGEKDEATRQQLYEDVDRLDDREEAYRANIGTEAWTAAYEQYKALNKTEGMTATDKAIAFSQYLERQVGLNERQKALLREQFGFYNISRGRTDTYDNLTGAGLSPDKAAGLYDAVHGLQPLPGKNGVTQNQKIWVIANNGSLTEDEKWAALEIYASDACYKKAMEAKAKGKSYAQWAQEYTKGEGADSGTFAPGGSGGGGVDPFGRATGGGTGGDSGTGKQTRP